MRTRVSKKPRTLLIHGEAKLIVTECKGSCRRSLWCSALRWWRQISNLRGRLDKGNAVGFVLTRVQGLQLRLGRLQIAACWPLSSVCSLICLQQKQPQKTSVTPLCVWQLGACIELVGPSETRAVPA